MYPSGQLMPSGTLLAVGKAGSPLMLIEADSDIDPESISPDISPDIDPDSIAELAASEAIEVADSIAEVADSIADDASPCSEVIKSVAVLIGTMVEPDGSCLR